MAKKIYLVGGRVSSGGLREIDTKALEESENKKIFVINLTTNDQEILNEKRERHKKYFEELGAEVTFISDLPDNPEQIEEKLNNSGLLYISGGDTEILIKNIKEMGLGPLIKNFKGVIEGNSAGAYLLCKEHVEKRESRMKPGLGLINLRVKAHYNPELDSLLLRLSKGKKIYTISENCAIVWDNGEINFIGDIYLFSNGKKEKVN